MRLLLEAQSKKRVRLSQWQKDWAVVHGLKLRGRGRPRKVQSEKARNSS
jgi:hypothetical protein